MFFWNLSPAFTLVSCSAYSSTVKMEATCSFETCLCFHAGFLFRLFLHLEDGGDMFLWNLSPDFTLVSCSAYSSTLKMEVTCSFETCHLLSRWFLAHFILWPLRWRLHVPPKFVTCFDTGFLLGLFFHPEDGGYMFLRNLSPVLTLVSSSDYSSTLNMEATWFST
jgi:hypothetical protein